MKTKSTPKSRGQFGHRYPTNNQNKAHAMIRRRAWRCVRPVVKEPDVIALRKLEQIDFRELLEILEEEKCSAARAKSGGCKTPAEERRDHLHQLTWLHFMGGLYGRTQPDLDPAVRTNLAKLQRSLEASIRALKRAGRRII